MKKLLILLFPFLFVSSANGNIQKPIKLITVFCSTLEDKRLGGEIALQIMNNYFAQNLNPAVDHVPYTIVGEKFNHEYVREFVRELERDSEAIIFFYIYDHGERSGSVLPLVNCYTRKGTTERRFDPEKEVLEPLRRSNRRFVFLMVDACNNFATMPDNPLATDEQFTGINYEEVVKVITASGNKKFEGHIKPFQVTREYKKNPFNLLLSAHGYLAISTSRPGQKMYARPGSAGLGTLLFFYLLANPLEKEKNQNWLSHLYHYRSAVARAARELPKDVQTPVWIGVINGVPVPDEEVLYPGRRLKEEEAISLLSGLSADNLIEEGVGIARTFCELTNASGNKPAAGLQEICVPYGRLNVFDDVAYASDGTSKYINYREYLKQYSYRTSGFLVDSNEFDGIFEDTINHNLLLGYRVDKRLSRYLNDENLRQLIVVEVQSQKRSRNQTAPPSLKVARVLNLPQPYREPPLPVDTIAATTRQDPVLSEEINPSFLDAQSSYSELSPDLISRFFDLLGKAMRQGRVGGEKENVLREARDIFQNPAEDQIEISRLHTDTFEIIGPRAIDRYLGFFWTFFPPRYDSVELSFCNLTPVLLSEPNIYVEPMVAGVWRGFFEFRQLFRGFVGGKVVFQDSTTKRVEVILTELKIDEETGRIIHKVVLGNITVIDTGPASDCPPRQESDRDR